MGDSSNFDLTIESFQEFAKGWEVAEPAVSIRKFCILNLTHQMSRVIETDAALVNDQSWESVVNSLAISGVLSREHHGSSEFMLICFASSAGEYSLSSRMSAHRYEFFGTGAPGNKAFEKWTSSMSERRSSNAGPFYRNHIPHWHLLDIAHDFLQFDSELDATEQELELDIGKYALRHRAMIDGDLFFGMRSRIRNCAMTYLRALEKSLEQDKTPLSDRSFFDSTFETRPIEGEF